MLYDDKMVRINNPQVIDVLKYENRMGVQKTIPVVVEKKNDREPIVFHGQTKTARYSRCFCLKSEPQSVICEVL